jgi:hypothetical protein
MFHSQYDHCNKTAIVSPGSLFNYGYYMKIEKSKILHLVCINDQGLPSDKHYFYKIQFQDKFPLIYGLKEIEYEGVVWIHVAQNRDKWRAHVNKVMKFGFGRLMAANFLTR